MTTQMEIEAREAPQVIATELQENGSVIKAISRRLEKIHPAVAITIGRGSSDHACTFAKYLLETQLGIPTVSAAPSVLTMYGSKLETKNALVIGISQSGKSPDICDVMKTCKQSGAITLAIVNELDSPLAKTAEFVIPMLAGPETAVAATKSYIASLSSLIQLVATLANNKKLLTALEKLPENMLATLEHSWEPAIPYFESVNNTLVLGRGFSYPTAQEAALKFKETCSIQAEAFSGAEVLHGPFALIKAQHPYLLFTQNDNSLEGMLTLAQKIRDLGGKTLIATAESDVQYFEDIATEILLLPKSLHPICDPLMIIQAFYLMIAKLAVRKGFNPDKPDNLNKITETV